MNSFVSLLQTVLLAEAEPQTQSVIPFDLIWQHVTSLNLVEALTFIAFGTVWLFYGWRIFKILVTICFGLLGLFLGVWANEQLIDGNSFWLALICVVFFAVLSVPFMRWGVSILGALSGGILTSGAWLALGLPQQYIWAGGLVGLIAGGMISFIIFKIAVILFTSLGGSVLLAVGALAVVHGNLLTEEDFKELISTYQWLLPALLLVPMIVGMFLQNKFIKGAPDWNA
ncbi:MAG: hypothetical protein A2Y77_11545 [Planctomycetes bacterium RBG_13_62_9]|nr:MAG: hypothetical protein A2Y77_11545 [Planctomycetes bacterium RBG_13_62_9]